jgi:hypothetical protein
MVDAAKMKFKGLPEYVREVAMAHPEWSKVKVMSEAKDRQLADLRQWKAATLRRQGGR